MGGTRIHRGPPYEFLEILNYAIGKRQDKKEEQIGAGC
jgi:hypothetical protein